MIWSVMSLCECALPFSAEAQFLEALDGELAAPAELGTLAANCLDARKLSIYGGANGALKIAHDMPAEFWEQLK